MLKVDLVPAQGHELGNSQAMTKGDEDQGRISRAVSADSAGRLDELIDLLRRQMLPRTPLAVCDAPWWSNFPVFGCWPHLSDRRIARRKRGRYRLTFPFWGLFGKVSRNAHSRAAVAKPRPEEALWKEDQMTAGQL